MKVKQTCKQGHPMVRDNIYLRQRMLKDGRIGYTLMCLTCKRERELKSQHKRRARLKAERAKDGKG